MHRLSLLCVQRDNLDERILGYGHGLSRDCLWIEPAAQGGSTVPYLRNHLQLFKFRLKPLCEGGAFRSDQDATVVYPLLRHLRQPNSNAQGRRFDVFPPIPPRPNFAQQGKHLLKPRLLSGRVSDSEFLCKTSPFLKQGGFLWIY
jgi:hypothetical protein